MDADGQHPADAFKDLIAPIQNGVPTSPLVPAPHAGMARPGGSWLSGSGLPT